MVSIAPARLLVVTAAPATSRRYSLTSVEVDGAVDRVDRQIRGTSVVERDDGHDSPGLVAG